MHRFFAFLLLSVATPALAAAHSVGRANEQDSETSHAHLPPPPALPTKYVAVAVLPLQSFDIPDSVIPKIEQVLLDEIDETTGFRSVSSADVLEDLSALGLDPKACGRDVSCIAKAGRYARAHAVLDVMLSALGGVENISMRLLDTSSSKELGRDVEELPEEPQARLLVLHRMIVQLVTPDAYLGQVLVRSAQAGSEIYIDDTLVGLTPMRHAIALKAGVHILRISKEGFTDVNRFVDITFRRTTTLDVEMQDTTVNVQVDLIAAKNDGALFVLAAEAGYDVRIDGEPAGVTPLRGALLHLTPGQHQITLRKAGRPVVQQTVTIMPQQRADFMLVQREDGTLQLEPQGSGPATRPLPSLDSVDKRPALSATRGEAPQKVGRSWRTPSGIAIASVGLAGIVVGAIYEHDVQLYSDEAARISKSMKDGSVTTVAQAIALGHRLDVLNERGPTVTAAARAGLIGGGGLIALGAAFIVWDGLRLSDNPTRDDVATRLLPGGPGAFGLHVNASF